MHVYIFGLLMKAQGTNFFTVKIFICFNCLCQVLRI
jgi:hypothetical protein